MGAHGVQDEASDVGLHHRPPPSAAATISSIELSSGNSRMMGNKNSKEPDPSWPASEEKYQLQQDGDAALGGTTLEDAYVGVEIPAWHNQITLRGLLVSLVLGTLFCIITHKLNLTVGVIPSLNISAGLLGFFFIKTWTKVLSKCGIWSTPFTRQENTVIQTCVVSCYGIAFSGGFGSYLLGMDQKTHDQVVSTSATSGAPVIELPGNQLVKNPALGWMIGFVITVSFLGIFSIVALRKIMIIDYKLTYPSGTATAILINSFHSPEGAEVAKKQVKVLGKNFTLSFAFSFFKWFFSGIGDQCGFDNFPTLGLTAFNNRLFFDFSLTYVGAGMICPHIVNVSLLLGAILSWGLMWPLIQKHQGDWYPAGLSTTNFKGLYGYKVFIAIALILGDGFYNIVKITIISAHSIFIHHKNRQQLPVVAEGELDMLEKDKKRRDLVFLKEGIPLWAAGAGYVCLAAISIGVMPQIFTPVKWYFVLVCYIIAPILAFCNAYGCGLTDWSLASTYGKLGLFIFAAWAGANGGVLVGLAVCGVMMSIVSTASDLMQDFKTGYLTLSSPRSMFVSQLVGTLMGCFLAPATFWMFYKAFDLGDPNGEYPAPYALVYRSMAVVGVEGFKVLPTHCLQLCYGFFAAGVAINAVRNLLPKKVSQYIPIPMAMAIPFYIGGYFAIDMFLGTVIKFYWERRNRKKSDIFTPAIAAGLICGDGVWTIPSAILALAKVNPPLCMQFLPAKVANNAG